MAGVVSPITPASRSPAAMKKKTVIPINPKSISPACKELAKALAPIIRRAMQNPNICFVRPVGSRIVKSLK